MLSPTFISQLTEVFCVYIFYVRGMPFLCLNRRCSINSLSMCILLAILTVLVVKLARLSSQPDANYGIGKS